jgi:ABC-type glycerol-3-phosphate transport system substrate-binding protein
MDAGKLISRRSLLAGLTLTGAGAIVLQACGQPAAPAPTSAPASAPTTAPAGQPATTPAAAAPAAKASATGPLVVWKFGGATKELEYFPKWNDEFAKESGIKLEYSNNDWAVKREKMLAGFQAKRLGDILLADGQSLPDLAAIGIVTPYEDLDKGLAAKLKADYIPEIWETTVYKGKFYGISPYVDTGTFLTYNKKMLDEAGVTKVPETWDEVREAARKCTKGDVAGITISVSPHTNDANTFEGIAYANGGRWLDESGRKVMIEDPGFIDPLQLFVDLVKDKSVPQGVTETAFNQSGTLFFEQKAAMWVSLSYPGAFAQGNPAREAMSVGLTLFPRKAPTPSGSSKPASQIMTPTAAFFVSALTQQREAALKYIEFWSRPKTQAGWDGSEVRGRVPGLKANWETETFKKTYPDWYKLYKDNNKMFDGALPMPAFPGLTEAEKALSTAMQQAVLAKQAPKEALAAAAKRAQAIVDEFKGL